MHATLAISRGSSVVGRPAWLQSRPKYSDAGDFNLSDQDLRVAPARREKAFLTLEQIRHVM